MVSLGPPVPLPPSAAFPSGAAAGKLRRSGRRSRGGSQPGQACAVGQVFRGRPLHKPLPARHRAEGGRGPASGARSHARREGRAHCSGRYWVTLGSPESSFPDNQSGHWQEFPRRVQGALGREEETRARPLNSRCAGCWVSVAGPGVCRESSRGTPRPVTVQTAVGRSGPTARRRHLRLGVPGFHQAGAGAEAVPRPPGTAGSPQPGIWDTTTGRRAD